MIGSEELFEKREGEMELKAEEIPVDYNVSTDSEVGRETSSIEQETPEIFTRSVGEQIENSPIELDDEIVISEGNNKIDFQQYTLKNIKDGEDDQDAVTVKQLSEFEPEIEDGSITTDKLADGAVSSGKIANNAVTTDKINDGAVTNGKIADGAITTGKIASKNVETGNLADGAVTNDKLAENAVTTNEIADEAITTAKIGDYQITEDKIMSNAVTNDKIANNTISSSKINFTTESATLSFPNTSVTNDTTIPLTVQKFGKIVFITGRIKLQGTDYSQMLSADVTNAVEIPVGFRPQQNLAFAGQASGNRFVRIAIDSTTGLINLGRFGYNTSNTSAQPLYLSPSNPLINIFCVYLTD